MKPKSKREKELDYLKANRKGSRDAELENSTGWKATEKAHKTMKDYKRKPKHKNDYY